MIDRGKWWIGKKKRGAEKDNDAVLRGGAFLVASHISCHISR